MAVALGDFLPEIPVIVIITYGGHISHATGVRGKVLLELQGQIPPASFLLLVVNPISPHVAKIRFGKGIPIFHPCTDSSFFKVIDREPKVGPVADRPIKIILDIVSQPAGSPEIRDQKPWGLFHIDRKPEVGEIENRGILDPKDNVF